MDWLEVGGIRAYGYTGYLEAVGVFQAETVQWLR